MNWDDSLKVFPDGVQTLSKMPEKYIMGIYPKYIAMGKGANVYDDKGVKYVDYTCGLGAILLGYANERINKALIKQMSQGILFGLPNPRETELAEMIKDIVPSAESMRFLKTGSEACAAAVKIARAYTGREIVLSSGYHGWHDWFTVTTPKNKGIPACYAGLIRTFQYNDFESFEKELDKDVACVIMEPYIYDAPKDNFLNKVQGACKKNKTVLIFDEVVTGFRTTDYTAQKMFKVIPDLTVLGKALGNGLPMGVVCGKRDLMDVLKGDVFVSSTFGGELLSIAAAIETIKVLKEERGIDRIWESGERVKSGFNSLVASMQMKDDMNCSGYPCRTFFKFPSAEHKGLFWQECLGKGVLFGFAQFTSMAHDLMETDITLEAMRHGLMMVKKYFDEPKKALRGEPPQETLRMIAR